MLICSSNWELGFELKSLAMIENTTGAWGRDIYHLSFYTSGIYIHFKHSVFRINCEFF